MTDGGALQPFLDAFVEDRRAGTLRPLAFYIALCPGHEGEVAERFATILATHPPPAAAPAEAIGPYRVERELGRGGQGVVYLAVDARLSRRVAIKVLTGRGFLDTTSRERFLREARIAGRLDHPGICPVYDVGTHDGDPYLVMRYVDGAVLSGQGYDTEPLALIEKVARAIHVAHEAGVVHRDLKPGNVMIDRRGEPVVLDFGLAHDDSDDVRSLTHVTDRIGTPAYMAPEQIEPGLGTVDRRTDVWALGVMLWERLFGQRPFRGPTTTALSHAVVHAPLPNPRRGPRRVSPDLAVVMTTALQRAPARRYATALDFAEDLRRVRAGLPTLARPPGSFVRALRWVARNRLVSALAGALLLSMGLGLWSTIRTNRDLRRALADAQWRADAWSVEMLVMNNRQTWRRDAQDRWMVELAIRRFEDLLGRRAAHVAHLATVPADDAQSRRALEDHLLALDRLTGHPLAPVEWLRHKQRLIDDEQRQTLEDARPAWERVLAEIAATEAYAGLPLTPQVGLVPLGRDPTSGLQEFALWRTGTTPRRDASGRLTLDEDSAMVFVLVPRGTLPAVGGGSARAVAPFLIGKHEVTAVHWEALIGPTTTKESPTRDPGLPLREISYELWYEQLFCNGLALPDEVQWEYAARAGEAFAWPGGDDPASIAQFARLDELAPIGTRTSNAFGLHDVIGNVAEFCRDADDVIAEAAQRPHWFRGGHHGCQPGDATLASRYSLFGRALSARVGARAVRGWR